MPEADLSFSPLTRRHFDLLISWFSEPHISPWWPPQSLEEVEREYGPCIDGGDPTQVFICHVDGEPAGMVQIYRLADEPQYERAVGLDRAAGIDLLLDAARCGLGLGPRVIRAAADLIWACYPEVTQAMAGPSVHNGRSIRAFEKAGFVRMGPVRVPDEKDEELIVVLARPTGGA